MSADFATNCVLTTARFLSCIVITLPLMPGPMSRKSSRAGIQSIDRGQMEASRALGMPW